MNLLSQSSGVSLFSGRHFSLKSLAQTKFFFPIRALALVFLSLAAPLSVLGQSSSVTLAWNPSSSGGVTGYRVYEGTAPRSYTTAITAGNTTQATVPSLTNGITYYFSVAAYNAAGVESDYSPELMYTPGTNGAAPSLVFAASAGTVTAPFAVSNNIVSQPNQTTLAASGRAQYAFTIIKPGPYVVIANVDAPSGSANSFFVNVDAEPADPANIWDIPVTAGFENWTVGWTGATPKVFTLTAGAHQLIVRGREGNVQLASVTISPSDARLEMTRLPGREVLLGGMAKIGQAYEVQATSDLKNWATIGNVRGDNSGSINFLDSTAPAFAKRFYRLHEIPNMPPPALKGSDNNAIYLP